MCAYFTCKTFCTEMCVSDAINWDKDNRAYEQMHFIHW